MHKKKNVSRLYWQVTINHNTLNEQQSCKWQPLYVVLVHHWWDTTPILATDYTFSLLNWGDKTYKGSWDKNKLIEDIQEASNLQEINSYQKSCPVSRSKTGQFWPKKTSHVICSVKNGNTGTYSKYMMYSPLCHVLPALATWRAWEM